METAGALVISEICVLINNMQAFIYLVTVKSEPVASIQAKTNYVQLALCLSILAFITVMCTFYMLAVVSKLCSTKAAKRVTCYLNHQWMDYCTATSSSLNSLLLYVIVTVFLVHHRSGITNTRKHLVHSSIMFGLN